MANFFSDLFKSNKTPCYLKNSGLYDTHLKQFNEFAYDEIFENENVSEYFKVFVYKFLREYNISLFKYSLNQKYLDNLLQIEFSIDRKEIAPSLIYMEENFLDKPSGFPHWFFIAFPDVAVWAIKGSGMKFIRNFFSTFPQDEVIENGKLKMKYIKIIIDEYLTSTRKPLECKLY